MNKSDQEISMRFRQLTAVGRMVLLLTMSIGALGYFNDTVRAQTPPAIKDVQPKVAQVGGSLKLVFSQPVKPTSVMIGAVNASIVAPSAVDKIELTVPVGVALGRQQITVTTEGGTQPITGAVAIAPVVLGLRAYQNAKLELSRVVMAGGEVIVQFSDKIPTDIRQSLEIRLIETKPTAPSGSPSTTPRPTTPSSSPEDNPCANDPALTFMAPEDDYLIVDIPKGCPTGVTYALGVLSGGTPLEKQTRIKIDSVWHMLIWASLIVLGLILLVFILYKLFYRVPEGRPRYNFLKMLLLEQENQTYSLSRAQFLGWLMVIVWCYLFMYYAHGFVERSWFYPKLGNAIYAFLISLGTLIAAQATNRGMGVKGAGEEHPSMADLVVHGGVIALDRVQQLIWTLIALGMFVRITVSTYATATELPDIPNELLALMGLSSAGYLGGKLVRGPGPVIEQVTPRQQDSKVVLNIKGRHLSKEGFVWLDGVQQAKDNITIIADDADEPLKFAKELELSVDTTLVEWNAKTHDVTIVNSDAQRADLRILSQTDAAGAGAQTGETATGETDTGEDPEITEVTVGESDATGNVTLTIEGAGISPGAKITIAADPSFQPLQDSSDPNLFTVQVTEDWTTQAHQLLLESNGKVSSFTFPPS